MVYKMDEEVFIKIFEGYDDCLHIEEAAKSLRMSFSNLRKLVANKIIPAVKHGKRFVFLKTHLIHYYKCGFEKKVEEVNKLSEKQ